MEGIVIDRNRSLVFLRVTGFLDSTAIDSITEAMRSAAVTLGDQFGQHDFLYDLTDTQVAGADAVDRMCAVMADPATRHRWAHRIAFFTPSALLRRQLQRVCAVRPGRLAVFPDRKSASDWLIAERPPTPAPVTDRPLAASTGSV